MALKVLFKTALTANDSTAKDALGDMRFEDGKWYKYVLFNNGTGDVAAAANQMAYYHGDDGMDDNEVTSDYTDGIVAAGLFQAVLTEAYYGWIQVAGYATLALAIAASTDAAPVAAADGDSVILDPSIDGGVQRVNTVNDNAIDVEMPIASVIDASLKKVILQIPH